MDIIRRKGFTLIELLAVILILGIIALIAIPTVNKVLKESRRGAFNTTAVTLGNKAEEACQLENLKEGAKTSLYTIVEGKLDKPLEIKGDLPREGYILVNDKCEVAYSFYDENNVVSKNFKESKAIVNNKDTAPAYGLKWQSNTVEGDNYLDDTYTRTLDASDIANDSVKAQVGNTPVTNAFDELDIYKDIVPYTDSFGNEFMLIPKFYISKTKEVTETEVIWNYAVSKHKLDDTYYLPSNFVDEGIDNNKHIELPYVLVGKYEAGSNGAEGDAEMFVSKSGLMPKVDIDINTARTLATRYNDIGNIKGYQQYDIHVHDLLTVLFAIEYKTMNSQSIMRGCVSRSYFHKTGESDFVTSSSGTKSNGSADSFNYRGIENLWGNVWAFLDGSNIDNANNTFYVSKNSHYYSSEREATSYEPILEYKNNHSNGYNIESGFDSNFPFANFAIKYSEDSNLNTSDYVYQCNGDSYRYIDVGGGYNDNAYPGLHDYHFCSSDLRDDGSRLVVTPLRD